MWRIAAFPRANVLRLPNEDANLRQMISAKSLWQRKISWLGVTESAVALARFLGTANDGAEGGKRSRAVC